MNGDQKVGPFTFSVLNEIREKNGINDETLVSLDDGINWTSYKNISVWSHAAAMTEEDSETKFKPRIEEPPLRGNKNSTVLRAERKSKEKDNKGSKPTITVAQIEKAQNTQANYNDDKPIKEKTSIFRHLLFGFMIAFCIALVTNSIRNDFHLITLNFIFNFERDLVYGYLMRLSAVIGSALAYLIMGSVALLFRRPTLFYIIICLTGFFGISVSI